jgi:hypothetical protein
MDTSKPLFSGTIAVVLGTVGVMMLLAAPVIPSPWGLLLGVAGFVIASLAGHAATPPSWAAGSPILQGTALAIGKAVYSVIAVVAVALPAGWPQSLAFGAVGLLALLVGYASPQLGSSSTPAFVDSSSTPVLGGAREAADVLNRVG